MAAVSVASVCGSGGVSGGWVVSGVRVVSVVSVSVVSVSVDKCGKCGRVVNRRKSGE